MSLIETKGSLVLVNDKLCWFILKSPNISNRPNFHIILTDLSDQMLQALKGFFLLLQEFPETNESGNGARSVCLSIDFSTVTIEKRVDVYKFLLKNVGPEITELRLSGMERLDFSIHPFSVSNPILLSTLNLPNLHTIRISNLGGKENIMWLSYFLNAAKNLKQLHIGPFDDVYLQGLDKLEIDGYYSLSPSAQFGSQNEVGIDQLQLLGQCVNFEEMSQAQLFLKGLWLLNLNSKKLSNFREVLNGTEQADLGIGIPLPTKIQIQSDEEKCDENELNVLCNSPSLVALSGLGFDTRELKVSLSFCALVKLEVKSTPTWLLDNLENFPSLKHLIWQPNWTPQIQNAEEYDAHCDQYYDQLYDEEYYDQDDEFGQYPQNRGTGQQESPNTVEDLRPQIDQIHENLQIFRIVHDWKTCKSLPGNAFKVIQLFSSSFPRLKIFSCEVDESNQVNALLAHFPQVKEFHFNKYVSITQTKTEVASQVYPRTGRQIHHYNSHNQPQVTSYSYSYKLETFRQKMICFKNQVQKCQNTSLKDAERSTIKIGAFIYDESTELFRNGTYHDKIELNVPEICSTISNLNLSEIVIPVSSHGEALKILEEIKSSEPKDVKHVHFQIMEEFNSYSDFYDGIPQQLVESYKPFFLVTFDFQPGQNTLNCSVLAKDFWE